MLTAAPVGAVLVEMQINRLCRCTVHYDPSARSAGGPSGHGPGPRAGGRRGAGPGGRPWIRPRRAPRDTAQAGAPGYGPGGRPGCGRGPGDAGGGRQDGESAGKAPETGGAGPATGAAGGRPQSPGAGRGLIRAGMAAAFLLGTADWICTSRPRRSGPTQPGYVSLSHTDRRAGLAGPHRLRKTSVMNVAGRLVRRAYGNVGQEADRHPVFRLISKDR
jgi:hypothetical protein